MVTLSVYASGYGELRMTVTAFVIVYEENLF